MLILDNAFPYKKVINQYLSQKTPHNLISDLSATRIRTLGAYDNLRDVHDISPFSFCRLPSEIVAKKKKNTKSNLINLGWMKFKINIFYSLATI